MDCAWSASGWTHGCHEKTGSLVTSVEEDEEEEEASVVVLVCSAAAGALDEGAGAGLAESVAVSGLSERRGRWTPVKKKKAAARSMHHEWVSRFHGERNDAKTPLRRSCRVALSRRERWRRGEASGRGARRRPMVSWQIAAITSPAASAVVGRRGEAMPAVIPRLMTEARAVREAEERGRMGRGAGEEERRAGDGVPRRLCPYGTDA